MPSDAVTRLSPANPNRRPPRGCTLRRPCPTETEPRLAAGTVPRRSVATEVATILDSPEVAALVAELESLRWVGRKGYGARTMLGACIVKALYALPTWTRVADLIADNPRLTDVLGGTPSHWACYRFAAK